MTWDARYASENEITKAYMLEIPACDFCDRAAEYDANMNRTHGDRSPWAYMCRDHWLTHSDTQLGTGRGQRIIRIDGAR